MEKRRHQLNKSKEKPPTFEEFSGVYEEGVEQLRPINTRYGTVSLASDVGVEQRRNEDRVFMETSRNLFGVADGIGGYDRGDEAAQIVAEEIIQGTKANIKPAIIQFEASNRMRNNQIFMGGACYLYFQIEKKSASIYWAGDVRLIVVGVDGGLLYQTKSTEIADAPRGQSMGNLATDVVDVLNYHTIIAASDGLWDNVDMSDVLEIVKDIKSGETDILAKKLFSLAKSGMQNGFLTDYGGHTPDKRKDYGKKDNVSIVVFQKLPQA